MSGWIVLFFSIALGLADDIGISGRVISAKMISDLFRKDLLQGSLKSTACGRNVASQIKWLSCMFTSIFGDISMTIQAETLLKGEGWRCPFTQERAGVIHQPGCCPFSTAGPSCLLLTTPPPRALTPLLPPLYQHLSFCHSPPLYARRGAILYTESFLGFYNLSYLIICSWPDH